MQYKLSKAVKVGQKILVGSSWLTINAVTDRGVQTSAGEIVFGSLVQGWKA